MDGSRKHKTAMRKTMLYCECGAEIYRYATKKCKEVISVLYLIPSYSRRKMISIQSMVAQRYKTQQQKQMKTQVC